MIDEVQMNHSNDPQPEPEGAIHGGDLVDLTGLGPSTLTDPVVSPCHAVINNVDLLHMILVDLKFLVGAVELDKWVDEESTWKREFLAFILVNRHFFDQGTNIIWDTMDSFRPLFSLLPGFAVAENVLGDTYYVSKSTKDFRSKVVTFADICWT